MKKQRLIKVALLLLVIILVALAYYNGLHHKFTLSYLKDNLSELKNYVQENQLQSILIMMGVYIATTAVSFPGATVLTLATGALFGVKTGTIMVSLSSTIGATIAFLFSRFLLREWIQEKYGQRLKSINEGVEKDGALYLLTLRLIPLVPFFVINLTMGLTKMRTFTYFIVSMLGMFPATIAYVNAGTQLSKVDGLKGILSLELILSFAFAGIVIPLFSKWLVGTLKKMKAYRGYKKPKNFDYNMIVIGAGAGGLVSSYIAATVKARVLLIEKHKMGGDCLNTGCVPSKAILKSAKVASQIQNAAKYGLNAKLEQIDFKAVMGRVHQVIKEVEPHDSVERYTGLGVECENGHATIVDPWTVEVNGKKLTAQNLVIATGASPRVIPIKGLDESDLITSENLWELEELPENFLVIGAGPIGLEMAQSFNLLGSNVHVVTHSDRIMNIEDPDVSEIVHQELSKDGVKIHVNATVSHIEGKVAHLSDGTQIQFTKILMAIGRQANTKGFGLEKLPIEYNENGTIKTNEYLQTELPHITAVGDVTGPYQLTHMAAHQAWFASVNSLFGRFKKFKVDYSNISWSTYTIPEVATAGKNETQLKKEGIPYEVTTYPLDDLDRAIAESEKRGIIKVMTVPGSDKILGATVVADQASTMIIEWVTAMKNGIGLNKILGTIHAYPSYPEANKYVAGEWKKARKPEKLLSYLEKFFKWSRS